MPRTISTPNAPGHLSFISQGFEASGLLFAVTVPRDPETHEIPETFQAQAEQTFGNLAAVLEAGGSSIRQLVKLTVYLSDMGNWEAMNEVYKRFVNPDSPPVRCALQVGRMNNDYMIELDAIALAKIEPIGQREGDPA